MDAKIDFDSHLPYYIQLIDILRDKVQTGTWAPGDQIPGEQELCELYKVSRTVVRQALRGLELDGMITRRKGKGKFIAPPKISEGLVQELTGFYQDMANCAKDQASISAPPMFTMRKIQVKRSRFTPHNANAA